MRPRRLLLAAAIVATLLFALVAKSALAAAKTTPTLTVSAAGLAAPAQQPLTLRVGQTAHLTATGLDPTDMVELYKGQWIEGAAFTGWTWVYYKGFPVAANGTWSGDDAEDSAGTFRFQVSQSSGGRHPSVVTSAYVGLTVGG
jgi:hypothetical protein